MPQTQQQQQLHAARHLSFTGSNANNSVMSNSSLASGSFTSSGYPGCTSTVPGSPSTSIVASATAAPAAAAATQQLRGSSSSLQVRKGRPTVGTPKTRQQLQQLDVWLDHVLASVALQNMT
jgi:hypothetical protein